MLGGAFKNAGYPTQWSFFHENCPALRSEPPRLNPHVSRENALDGGDLFSTGKAAITGSRQYGQHSRNCQYRRWSVTFAKNVTWEQWALDQLYSIVGSVTQLQERQIVFDA